MKFGRSAPAAKGTRSPLALVSAALKPVGSLLFRLRPLSLVGIVFFCLSFWARLPVLNYPFGYFDEGLLFTNANLILLGSLPYRDFYTNYGPGPFFMVAGIWKAVGILHLAVAVRVLAILVHLTISVASGRLAGLIIGRRFSWLCCGIVSLNWLPLLDFPYAWTLGLTFAFVSLVPLLAAFDRPARSMLLLAGLALGLLGLFRHDLLVYVALVLGCCWILPAGIYRRLALTVPPRRRFGWLGLGAAAVLIPAWVPLLVKAGPHRVIDDLFLTQIRYVMPARVLPLPNLLARTAHGQWVFWRSRFEAAVVLTLLGPILALILLAWRRTVRIGLGGHAIIGVGALAVAVVPQMMGRTDWVHALFTIPPALTLLSALIEIAARRYSALWLLKLATVFGVVIAAVFPNWLVVWPPTMSWPRYVRRTTYSTRAGFYEPNPQIAQARRAVLAFIAQHTAPEDAIYVGTIRHDRVFANEIDLYFLANRRAGTRYTQFDPNVVTREEVQKEMIDSLERNAVRVLVLSNRIDFYESQSGVLPGSTVFDEYIASHFKIAETDLPYFIYTRID